MRSQKICWPWGLGPGNCIWATRAQETYQAISLEPYLRFSQKDSFFLQNYKINLIKLLNLRSFLDLGVWGLERNYIHLGNLSPVDGSSYNSRTLALIFT